MPTDPSVAISVEKAYKAFGWGQRKSSVLINLTINITKGHIYGLLGPSGSGKTTLLQCIIGKDKLDSGRILVFGNVPGSRGSGIPGMKVGFMPQELALYLDLTTREILNFFGHIYEMSSEDISQRINFLLDFLDLPTKPLLIEHMSGGQQRRASLAVALLHEPELLILDEPTVGVDPVLRRNIWDHLVNISNQPDRKTTIVITTHYVDEARMANMVGMLRFGRILAQGSPSDLLESYDKSSLEAVFLSLCLKEESETSMKDDSPDFLHHHFQVPSLSRKKPYRWLRGAVSHVNSACSLKHIRAITSKNFVRMWRSPMFLIFQIILPALQVSIFCLAIGKNLEGLSLAVVNEEVSGGKCTGYSTHCKMMFPPPVNPHKEQHSNLSCHFLSHIDTKIITLFPYSDYETAREAVTHGDIWGIIHILPNFSQAFIYRSDSLFLTEFPNQVLMNRSYIYVDLDSANQQVTYFLKRSLYRSFRKFLDELISSCYKIEEASGFPISLDKPIYGSMEPSFTEFMAPGVILSIAFFTAVGLTAESFIHERNTGFLDRTWVAGVTSTENMLSYILAQLAVVVTQVTCVLISVLYIFQVPFVGSAWLMSFLTILQGICGMSLGLFISSLCTNEETALEAALGLFYPAIMLSGVIWPLEGMPEALRKFSMILPQTLACKAMRGIFSKGWDLRWSEVLLGFFSTTLWILLLQMASVYFLRKRNHN